MKFFSRLLLSLSLVSAGLLADQPVAANQSYVLGPDDGITVNVAGVTELDAKTLGAIKVDHEGNVILPLAGRVHVSGLSVEAVEKEIAARLSNLMNSPEVSVTVSEYRSHPVSVLGAVRTPGVYQVNGPKTLFEVLSLAGGLSQDASNRVKVTRSVSSGPLPIANATMDKTGDFYTAELSVRSVMNAKSPEENIQVLPNDVITVPKAELIYVVGAVHKSGGFALIEKEHISILEALSLAEGLDKIAKGKDARILRQQDGEGKRVEVAVNVDKILSGKAEDVSLRANDILYTEQLS